MNDIEIIPNTDLPPPEIGSVVADDMDNDNVDDQPDRLPPDPRSVSYREAAVVGAGAAASALMLVYVGFLQVGDAIDESRPFDVRQTGDLCASADELGLTPSTNQNQSTEPTTQYNLVAYVDSTDRVWAIQPADPSPDAPPATPKSRAEVAFEKGYSDLRDAVNYRNVIIAGDDFKSGACIATDGTDALRLAIVADDESTVVVAPGLISDPIDALHLVVEVNNWESDGVLPVGNTDIRDLLRAEQDRQDRSFDANGQSVISGLLSAALALGAWTVGCGLRRTRHQIAQEETTTED
jgi:hypothetical protein